MKKQIPQIGYKRRKSIDIEIVDFNQIQNTLLNLKSHNPFKVHKIDFYLILVVTKNSYTHYVDFKPYQLKKGSALFIAKNQVHHFTKELINSDGYCIIFSSLYMTKDYLLADNLKLNKLFNYHTETPVIHQEELEHDDFITITNNLHREYTLPNNIVKAEMLQTLLYVLLLKASRAKQVQSIDTTKTHWVKLFNIFKNLLEKNYIHSRSSRYYSKELNISYKFLNDIVKNYTGKTVKKFINDFVTLEIKRYLATTHLSVKEVSYKTGFDEPANMIKFFKKNTQETPLHYKTKI